VPRDVAPQTKKSRKSLTVFKGRKGRQPGRWKGGDFHREGNSIPKRSAALGKGLSEAKNRKISKKRPEKVACEREKRA